ncbi:sugar transferase [Puniceicoccaceae bacterium K14]|nr:sugar transferase [Puniceicoccaceae bacterium K14]
MNESTLNRKATQDKLVTVQFLGDITLVVLSMVLGHVLRFQYLREFGQFSEASSLNSYSIQIAFGLLLFLLIAKNQILYDYNRVVVIRHRSVFHAVKVVIAWSFIFLGASLVLKLSPGISRLFVGCSALMMIVLLTAWRIFLYGALMNSKWMQGAYQRVAVIGANKNAEQLVSRISKGESGPYQVAGIITTSTANESSFESSHIGDLKDFESLVNEGHFDAVAVADMFLSKDEVLRVARICERNYIDFKMMSGYFEVFTSCLQLQQFGGFPVMGLNQLPQTQMFNRILKRAVDFAGGMFGLFISLPIFAVLIPLIKMESRGPILYRQIRTGQHGKEFYILKLRSMKTDAEANGKAGWSTLEDPRRTKIGTFMRKYNLDELPQFWNVVKGEMSLVGPRPERPELIENFVLEIPYYQSRHSVKPGMTGWAQVHGLRGDTSISERIRYDLDYIENWSLWKDFTIKFRTVLQNKNAC